MSEHESKVPCKECGTPTAMTSTKLCDSCWEKDRHGVFDLREQLAKVTAERDKLHGALTIANRACKRRGEERDRLRKAGNTLADAAKKRLSEWTRETYMAVQESETAWREAVGGGEVEDAG